MEPEKLFTELKSMSEAELLKLIEGSEEFSAQKIKDYLDYIYDKAPPVDLGLELYDCCGTGGDGANTFNISTTAAIVAAAMGIKICKNGGRSSSSSTGSVDVLEAIGLNLAANLEQKFQGLKECNLAFYSSAVSAELLAPIKQICRKHKLTSFISLIGPLASPVKLEGQVLGLGKEKWLGTMVDLAKSLIQQGLRKSTIVLISEFADGSKVDELTSASKSQIIVINEQKQTEFEFHPQDLDLNDTKEELIGGKDHQENAGILASILRHCEPEGRGNPDPKLNTVALNAAILQYLANKDQAQSQNEFMDLLNQYFEKAKAIIYSGKTLGNFNRLKEIYQD